MRMVSPVAVAFAALISAACGHSPTAPTPPPAPTPAPTPPPTGSTAIQFSLSGNPESPAGATWTCRGTVDGIAIDLEGILLKPGGAGPFPAVVISHGGGGNARQYSAEVGQEMRGWGLVAIGPNYTHAAGVPAGTPGPEPGASAANALRSHAMIAILAQLGYVDVRRVAAHGHSMGAFATAGYAATYPNDLRVASHTAGGARPDAIPGAAVSESQGAAIRTPYQWHHGDADVVVPLSMDQRLDAALARSGVAHEGHVYAGASHADLARHPQMLERVRAWYAAHGLF
jgi:dienelactone hydrolase